MLVVSMLMTLPFVSQTPTMQKVAAPESNSKINFVNLRVGASSADDNGRPQLCLEVAPLAFLKVQDRPFTRVSVEACGTGAGVLHDDPAPEMAHFRVKARVWEWARADWGLQLLGGLGWAELQVGRDRAGFRFSDAGPEGSDTSGPEASAHLRGMFDVAYGTEVLVELTGAAAYLPAARSLIPSKHPVQPSLSISLGFGF